MLSLGSGAKTLTAMVLCAAVAWGGGARVSAAMVRGIVVKGDGSPAVDDQVHLENQVTGNLYLTETRKDGSFSVDVPPGWYQLRERSGTIIKPRIRVDVDPVDLGIVRMRPQASFWRLFQHERLAPVLVDSPAPTTVDLSSGRRIPQAIRSEPDNATQARTQGAAKSAAQSNGASAAPEAPYISPRPSSAQSGAGPGSAENFAPPIKPDYEPVQTHLGAPGLE